MAAVCQDSVNSSSTLFGGPKSLQGPAAHNYYSHCGYEAPSQGPHQYTHDGYGQYQMPPPQHQQHQLHHHSHPAHHLNHHHHHHQPSHQQNWGYGMGVMGPRQSPHHIPLPDEWPHGYLMAGTNGSQNPYGYQYRPPTSHPMDYGTPPHPDSADPRVLDESTSPHTPSPEGPSPTGMGPNNQGAKALRAPFEWMKPSASLPSPGHGNLIAGKTRTKDKYRVVYSDHQRLELEKEFHFSKYITIRRKAEIAGQLGLSERQVKIWFQNRRAKERKQNKKREEQSTNQQSQQQHQQQQQQQQQQSLQNHTSGQNGHIHPHNFISSSAMKHHLQSNHMTSCLIPKLEVDEEDHSADFNGIDQNNISNLARMGCHTTQSPPNTGSEHVLLAMNSSSSMPGSAPILMDRCHPQHVMERYHPESFSLPPHVMSPGSHADDMMTLKMTSSDSSNNSMNMSGSSDSGVLSSQ